ncbi:MAG: rane protein [Nocardioides sp.]|nr:rane protein [Nocardioides sp.]
MTTDVLPGSRSTWGAPNRGGVSGAPWRRLLNVLAHPVVAAFLAAAVLHVLWWWLAATSGGDIAAQDAWAEFARSHPGSAYNLSWYGGMHPVSYSVLSPYVMALVGVRTTMMIAGTVSAALVALLVVRSRTVAHPLWPSLYGALALSGNAVSGRVTFGLGLMFGLAAVAAIYAWPRRWRTTSGTARWTRALVAAALSTVATAASPVAGLFLGVVAAALWLGRRHSAAYAVGLPPLAVVVASAWLFPFDGRQPMHWSSMILPVVTSVAVILLAPTTWRSLRIGAGVYAVGVVAVWAIPSPIGTNACRLGLLLGGVVLVSIAASERPWSGLAERWFSRATVTVLLAMALITSSIWQVAVAAQDAIATTAPAEWALDIAPLVDQLQTRNADLGRVEVVPTRTHREAAALTPYMNLARGWNRQADAERNPLFYQDEIPLKAAAYRAWLDRWAVHYVVLAASEPDGAAVEESALVAGGLPYLHEVWSDSSWRLFEVSKPTPLVEAPGVVTRFDAAEVDIYLPRAATVLVRIPDSPWLSLVDAEGKPIAAPSSDPNGDAPAVNVNGCLSELQPPTANDGDADDSQPFDGWTLLHAPKAGTYRIAGPYSLPRGTACPES